MAPRVLFMHQGQQRGATGGVRVLISWGVVIEATRPLGPRDGGLALMVVANEQVQWVPLDGAADVVVGRSPACDVFVPDASLSRRHAMIRARDGRVEVEDLGSRNGTTIAGGRLPPHQPQSLPMDALAELGSTVIALRRVSAVPEDALGPYGRVQHRVLGWVAAGSRLLLLGESGVGKRTLARMAMERACGVPLEVECAALRAAEIASWPSAARLLVRVSETPRDAQPALAAWLEATADPVVLTSRVDPATLARNRQADPRLIRALPTEVVVVPALAECGPEVIALARGLLRARAEQGPRDLDKGARAGLMSRSWPGNMEQLAEVLDTAVRVASGSVITREDLEADLATMSADARERLRILDALRECAGNQTSAAKQLGITRRALVYRLDKYGIERPRKPSQD